MPTAVLVHGAFHGGWCWRKVSALLVAQGWTVFAPSLTGLGDRAHLATPATGLDTHIQDELALIEAEELTDVVLCGHSAGGSVVTAVTDPEDAAWLARRMRPQPLRVLADPVVLSGPPDLITNQTHVRCEGFPVEYGERMVERAGTARKAAVHRTPAGHDAMITDPEFVARLIVSSRKTEK